MIEYFQPEVLDIDLPQLEEELGEEKFGVFLECLDKAIESAKKDPFHPSKELDYQLLHWYRELFFSLKPAPRGMNPDMRLVYRYQVETDEFFILVVGKRNAKKEDSVYSKAKQRDKTNWIKKDY